MAKTRINAMIEKNEEFADQNRNAHRSEHIVYVFAGAMSGIGAKILERTILASYHSTVFYVLWKFSDRWNVHRKMVLESLLNRGCRIVFIDADISLISDMDAASKQIMAAEEKVDYLCMSEKDMPPGKTTIISEGLHACLSLWYISRMRLLSNLLPLLRQSQERRVLNILSDGTQDSTNMEHGIDERVRRSTFIMTNLVFNHLATKNGQISFILSPVVIRGRWNFFGTAMPETMGVFLRAWRAIVNARVNVSERLFGRKPNTALERHIYYLSSCPCGPGAFQVDKNGELAPSRQPSEMVWEDDKSRPKAAWQRTKGLWQEALAREEADKTE